MRIVVFAMLVLIFIGGMVMIYPRYRRMQSLKAVNAELQMRIDAKKKAIEQLKENQRRFNNDVDFVEKIARQNHKVYPGELIFIFEE